MVTILPFPRAGDPIHTFAKDIPIGSTFLGRRTESSDTRLYFRVYTCVVDMNNPMNTYSSPEASFIIDRWVDLTIKTADHKPTMVPPCETSQKTFSCTPMAR